MASTPVADELEVEQALQALDIKAENGDVAEENGPDSLTPPIEEKSAEGEASTSEAPNGSLGHLVDHALRDALSRHKHRNSVLRLEAEVEAFVLHSTEQTRLFAGDMSSYDRLLVHRTAQHWGLDTSTVNQGTEHGSILVTRTPRTAPPPVRLTDLPVSMDEAPGARSTTREQGGAAVPPRVLVRRRGDRARGSQSPRTGGGLPGGPGDRLPSNIEERELHYERARARIFAGGDNGQQQQQQQQGAGSYPQQAGGGGGRPAPMSPHAAAAMMQHMQGAAAHVGAYGGAMGMPPMGRGGPGGYVGPPNGGGRGKAQLRNRQEDLSDPDFRRSRHPGPRYDPGGYGEDPMYGRPAYGAEFSEMAGGGGGAANGGAGGYPGGMMMSGHPMGPYAYAPGVMAHMGHAGMLAMQHGGGMAPGGQATGVHPMYAAHPQGHHHPSVLPPGMAAYPPGAYGMALGPYGYIPVTTGGSGQEGMAGMMPMQMQMAGYPGAAGGPGGGGAQMYGMMGGGSPGGMWHAQQQHAQQQQSSGGSSGRVERRRSRNGGGRSEASTPAVNTPRAAAVAAEGQGAGSDEAMSAAAEQHQCQ